MKIMVHLNTFIIILLLSCGLSACSHAKETADTRPINNNPDTVWSSTEDTSTQIPPGAKALIASYPDFIKSYRNGRLLLSDGTYILYDDTLPKSHIERMDNADIEDMFVQTYDTSVWMPNKNYEPGRIRNEALMKYMYGKTEQEVRENLVKIKWFNQKLKFTKINGAADSLVAVAKELESLDSSYHKYFDQSSTFNWRTVRGSNRLSAHSYGMTIDICTQYSDFWRWTNPGKDELDDIVYVNRIPKEIIRIFEKHGFISGARWYHYDTMHFEFRPDLLLYSSYKK